MSIRTTWGILIGVNCNNSVPDSSHADSCSDSFNPVEFESLLPQATSAAIATAALFVASHAMDQTQRASKQTENVEILTSQSLSRLRSNSLFDAP